MAELQQVGLRHPAAELVRDIQRNRTGIPRRAFVAEGLFENNIVLEAGVAVDTFLWRAGAPRLPDLGEDAPVPGRAAEPGRPDLDRPAAGYRPRGVGVRAKCPHSGD